MALGNPASRRHISVEALRVAQLCATIVHAIGGTALYGYISHTPRLYQWIDSSVPIAVPTAIAFVVISISVFIVATVLRNELEGP